ncbi:endonuclease/exonuclease/phosphatase family protein [Micromonospora aurantiaca (nom. illeg.)]|uniref:endonuclease/exonuclease/phosphatase family protein n=1 Tax=Micromonospora aurantiaca (nom. illeg.) TaxID=47850 RepID=UPI0033F147BB
MASTGSTTTAGTGQIAGTGADVVALQEIGSLRAAQDLQAALSEPWQAVVSSHPYSRGIRVAVLARHPLTEEAQILALPPSGLPAVPDVDGDTLTHMGRGALQVHVDCGGAGLRLLTAHLKSKLLTYPGGRRCPLNEDERARGAGYALLRRAAEAVALRVHLNEALAAAAVNGQPGMPTILCGDLNDGPDAITTVLLEGPADGDVNRPDKGDAVRLYNLGRRLPPNPRIFPHLPRQRRAHRPHPGNPRPPTPAEQRRLPRRRHHLHRLLHPQPREGRRTRPRPRRRPIPQVRRAAGETQRPTLRAKMSSSSAAVATR